MNKTHVQHHPQHSLGIYRILDGDRDKLRQIILNLLDNAAKFTERGEIEISASQQNGALKLVVSDTGIGIRKERHEPYLRGISIEENHQMQEDTAVRVLDLPSSKRLAGLLGGTIEVSSEVGEGSTFIGDAAAGLSSEGGCLQLEKNTRP